MSEELVERVARAICYNRAAPACNCRAKGSTCRALVENLMWESNEISSQARAAVRLALEEAARVAELAPYNRGGMVCGCSEGLSNWTAAAIRAMIKEGE